MTYQIKNVRKYFYTSLSFVNVISAFGFDEPCIIDIHSEIVQRRSFLGIFNFRMINYSNINYFPKYTASIVARFFSSFREKIRDVCFSNVVCKARLKEYYAVLKMVIRYKYSLIFSFEFAINELTEISNPFLEN